VQKIISFLNIGIFPPLKKIARRPTTVLLAELPDPFQQFFSKARRSALETAIRLSIENNAEFLIFQALDYRLTKFDVRHPKVADWANYTETEDWRKLEPDLYFSG
jgi:hypothetical protein